MYQCSQRSETAASKFIESPQCRRRTFGQSSLHRQQSDPGRIPGTSHIYRANSPHTKGQFSMANPANPALIFKTELPILERQNLPREPQMKLASALELLKPHVLVVPISRPKFVSGFEYIARSSWIRNLECGFLLEYSPIKPVQRRVQTSSWFRESQNANESSSHPQ